jgi:hypothetical protein
MVVVAPVSAGSPLTRIGTGAGGGWLSSKTSVRVGLRVWPSTNALYVQRFVWSASSENTRQPLCVAPSQGVPSRLSTRAGAMASTSATTSIRTRPPGVAIVPLLTVVPVTPGPPNTVAAPPPSFQSE